MKIQANEVEIGMTIKCGRHFIEVKNIIKDKLKNGKNVIYFGGNIISTVKNIHGKVTPPYYTKKYNSYWKEESKVNII